MVLNSGVNECLSKGCCEGPNKACARVSIRVLIMPVLEVAAAVTRNPKPWPKTQNLNPKP